MIRRPRPKPFSGTPLSSPLYQSVVYGTEDVDALDAIYGGEPGFTYSREGHPNARSVADIIDRLEGATGGVMTSSGMGAVSLALLSCLKAGDHAHGSTQLYGRSFRLMDKDLPQLGIETSFFDPGDIESARAAVRPNSKAILVEVVSNPTLRVADMAGIAAMSQEFGLTLIVDNTFTTPLGFKPFNHGASLVLHSVTKFMAGHSDAMLGWVGGKTEAAAARLDGLGATFGMTAAPFDCWLAERGLLSFELRFARAQENAAALADALAHMPGVTRVLYPTRADHPDHARATALLGAQGGTMVSFEIEGGRAAANALASSPGLTLAPTLGDITTTLSHPASSSHRELSVAEREALGISEGFFRLSVGVEPIEALIAMFKESLTAALDNT